MESHNEFTTAPSSQEADEWIEAFLKEPSRPSRFWVRSKPWNRFIVSRISECYSEYSVAARVVILFLLYSIHHGPDELRIEPEKTEDGGTKLRIADVRQGESVELVPPPSIIFDGIVKELKALAGLAGARHRLAERLRAVGRWIDGQPMHTSVGRFEIVAGDEIMRVDLHIIPSAEVIGLPSNSSKHRLIPPPSVRRKQWRSSRIAISPRMKKRLNPTRKTIILNTTGRSRPSLERGRVDKLDVEANSNRQCAAVSSGFPCE